MSLSKGAKGVAGTALFHFVTGCEILPVSQWGDDQARRVSQVLIAIANGSIDHPDHHIIILPVVPEARVHLFSCC